MQHAFYIEMGGFQVTFDGPARFHADKDGHIVEPEDGIRYTIRLDDLILLEKEGLLSFLDIPICDLQERSKSDQFTRVVTFLQVLYFVVVTLGRLGSGLPGITSRSVDTGVRVLCHTRGIPLVEKASGPAKCHRSYINLDKRTDFMSIYPRLRFNILEQDLAEKVDAKLFFDRFVGDSDMKRSAIHAVWIGCIFNGIHVFDWNYSFPSAMEHLLWRITSVGACVALVLVWASTFICQKVIGLRLAILFGTFYDACRIYLVVEVFSGLRSVPGACMNLGRGRTLCLECDELAGSFDAQEAVKHNISHQQRQEITNCRT